MNFHILGTGAIGCLVATYLRQSNHTVTLLLKNEQSLVAYRENDGVIYEKDGVSTTIRDFNFDLASTDAEDRIYNLVVTTKTYDAIEAVMPLTRRIGRQSTIILLQNGMGMHEDLARICFPDRSTRPSLVVGVNTHGVYRPTPFHVIHAGWKGDIHFGIVPREGEAKESEIQSGSGDEPAQQDYSANDARVHGGQSDNNSSPTSPTNNYSSPLPSTSNITSPSYSPTITALLALPLNTHFEPWPNMQCRILEKLVINCCINPVTALLRCRNGDLMDQDQGTQLIQHVCDEAAEVIRASSLVSDRHVIATRFTSDALQRIVEQVCQNTSRNESSMLQDVRARRITEVDYMNGYLSRIGKRLGIPTPANDILIALVKLQYRLAHKEVVIS
ncbi:ketopantoate reductase PanE/ApbA C terminal-domain-containing protein [Jimgerdemannia flammicorona]|uniref:Ketopantoate reductase PanE/ApbA C terminal-domain-containing protein n=1 Tax=Jimgerdemannia flammicorona TaxID=994334 RepID=A0A433QBL3_9FUNG|nr:ketopantoate reductase PanE/ApbA C terminal-domain-containing protein [Jimgerdemannia flammicorona]